MLLNFIGLSASKVCNINDTIGIKLITRLGLGFSHFENTNSSIISKTLNLLCSCSVEAESTSHYSLSYHFFDVLRLHL